MKGEYEKFVERYENHAIMTMHIWSLGKANIIIDELIEEGYELAGFSKTFLIGYIWWFNKRRLSDNNHKG